MCTLQVNSVCVHWRTHKNRGLNTQQYCGSSEENMCSMSMHYSAEEYSVFECHYAFLTGAQYGWYHSTDPQQWEMNARLSQQGVSQQCIVKNVLGERTELKHFLKSSVSCERLCGDTLSERVTSQEEWSMFQHSKHTADSGC